jgi:putative oxidoreductase
MLFGLLFLVGGASAFLFVSHPPAMPGLAGEFQRAFYESRWVLFVGAAQILAAILLVVNRFVNLALVISAAILYNIFAIHITMLPSGLPMAFLALILWLLVALPRRKALEVLLK